MGVASCVVDECNPLVGQLIIEYGYTPISLMCSWPRGCSSGVAWNIV